jgi:Flp pilus assembly pilin Flp
MLAALKWSGTSVTVGSLVAAITVRVIAGGAAVAPDVFQAWSARKDYD